LRAAEAAVGISYINSATPIVAQNSQQIRRRLPPVSQAKDIADQFFQNQQRSLPKSSI
jgi:hypothetical protein